MYLDSVVIVSLVTVLSVLAILIYLGYYGYRHVRQEMEDEVKNHGEDEERAKR